MPQMKALLVASLLLISACSAHTPSEPYPTGYILIGHPCSHIAEMVLLVFSDGSFVYIGIDDLLSLSDEMQAYLVSVRNALPENEIYIKGPFDTCPTSL
jgi:hypothetical protein